MEFSVNPEVMTGISVLASQIRDDLDEVEAEQKRLTEELRAVESALESAWRRFEIPISSVPLALSDEPPEPSVGGVNGHHPEGVTNMNGATASAVATKEEHPPPGEDQPMRRRYMRINRKVDYGGANEYREYVRCVAEATEDGVVNTTHMAEILREDGKSRSEMEHLPGTNGIHMRDSDDFRYLGPGTYMYLHHPAVREA